MDKRIRTLAKNLVNYSCKVKPGDKVYVHYTGPSTEDLRGRLSRKCMLLADSPFPITQTRRSSGKCCWAVQRNS